ncbi:23S rRNA (adenine(2030)-N(6))-methyltransferase RlmJ [Rhizobium leguminosarum bv. viciae]|uniref:23S rRNA (adenine(2030)-N(6))-methyltransferase RlmJ n=1 Tax=Rhizobium leguminosarum TaxID=384 RepID=UPI00103DFD20|nr:23S rRNA (adenine(2030)-N(6))-methyltransferase RlmJ [Rhizobium leguminosarum]MBY5530212.1 23S rRNA (adenine(2030)-N(6))-methyltransferase RlmJ [Rhizobium leguminosarum]TBY30683.1 23S rRNA (adenine(2030)-N(6))-methyltransferase RlmJ [Rhizobium leguminosarum bv. viciae]TBY35707.1 23S rRNA (adenine(2030)-N(6))-methyltransferase RlmJ [Rhizobium leguminosarum bv. viciae]TCA94797.1 23S rRNA (adenine(2030)-N(6))-methyltransferase RlmJ [Rhizobium leguminosarum bv. viciae]
MNYRHAYHAGNHTEVFKHAALTLMLDHLRLKSKPFVVLDTHSGIGYYDLQSAEALKTQEWEEGVGRIFNKPLTSAPAYSELLNTLNPEGLSLYPGSPEIISRLLRPGDRLVANELHPDDYDLLRIRYARSHGVQVQNRDGYRAIDATVPPPERRGLVFVDPPFEKTDEVQAMCRALAKGLRKWSTGIFCLWYPYKTSLIGDKLAEYAAEHALPDTLRADFLAFPAHGTSLAGGGLMICNAPWKFDEKLAQLCEELKLLYKNSSYSVSWITQPK